MFSSSTLDLLLENIETQASYLLRAQIQNVQSVTFITVNIGRNHWTLIIDNQTLKNILYFDSLGYQIPFSLRHALANLFLHGVGSKGFEYSLKLPMWGLNVLGLYNLP